MISSPRCGVFYCLATIHTQYEQAQQHIFRQRHTWHYWQNLMWHMNASSRYYRYGEMRENKLKLGFLMETYLEICFVNGFFGGFKNIVKIITLDRSLVTYLKWHVKYQDLLSCQDDLHNECGPFYISKQKLMCWEKLLKHKIWEGQFGSILPDRCKCCFNKV